MSEKYEKYFVFALIALAVYYFWKKFKTTQSAQPANVTAASAASSVFNCPPNADCSSGSGLRPISQGSIVNPTFEPGYASPYESSTPIIFKPAQPSSVPVSQRVSAGVFTYDGSTPYALRQGMVM